MLTPKINTHGQFNIALAGDEKYGNQKNWDL